MKTFGSFRQFALDLMVVGAGPVGLMAACEAAKLGMTVRVVDKRSSRGTLSRAMIVHARTMEALDGLGLSEKLHENGQPLSALNLDFGFGVQKKIEFSKLEWGDTKFPYWLNIPQYKTEIILEEKLNEFNVNVEWNNKLTGLLQEDDHVIFQTLSQSGEISEGRSNWLLGCDGGNSTTRELSKIKFNRTSLNKEILLTDVTIEKNLPKNEGHVFFSSDGLSIILPTFSETRAFRAILQLNSSTVRSHEPITARSFSNLFEKRTGMELSCQEIIWHSQLHLYEGLAETYRNNKVFILGDAAHVHSPVGGQGLNTGILDAHNLIWKLVYAKRLNKKNQKSILDSYEIERRPKAEKMVKITSLATKIMTLRFFMFRFIRMKVATAVLKTEFFKKRFARFVGLLEGVHPASLVAPPTTKKSSSLVGKRLPNIQLSNCSSLHDYLAKNKVTIIKFGKEEVHVINDMGRNVFNKSDSNTLKNNFGIFQSSILIVRPDHHILGEWKNLKEAQKQSIVRDILKF